jgi:signal transduction histidine kinase
MRDTIPSIAWQAARGAGSAAVCGAVQSLEGLVMGGVLQSGRPFLTHNLAGQAALFGAPPLQSAMAVPIRIAENVMGVLLCASTRQLNLTDVDVMFFSHLASYTATAVENAELMEQVQHVAALEERQRLAREMHDGFGQLLTFLGLRHHMLARYAEAGDTEAILAELARLNEAVQEAHGEVRHNIFRLKESGPPKATMQERWRQILIDYEARTGIHAEFEVDEGVPARLPEQTQVQLTRIVQEALTNVRNHSGALSVTVRLTMSDGALSVQIADDGCGFEPPAVNGANGHHFGLTIMRERAEAINAGLEIRSMRGNGTTVSVRLPAGKEGSHGDSSASGR